MRKRTRMIFAAVAEGAQIYVEALTPTFVARPIWP
jgi:hypothetical protein